MRQIDPYNGNRDQLFRANGLYRDEQVNLDNNADIIFRLVRNIIPDALDMLIDYAIRLNS